MADRSLEQTAELLLYMVENPNKKTEELRVEAYQARFGTGVVSETVYEYRMATIIADMHLHIAKMFWVRAGWHEGKGFVPFPEQIERGADRG